MWSTVLLQKLVTIARSAVALDWSCKVQVGSCKYGQCSLVKQLHCCAVSSSTFIRDCRKPVGICHYAPNKRFVPYPDQGDVCINRPDWHGFQCIKIFHCELSLHHQLLKTVLKADFIFLMLASKTKIPLLLKAIAASSTLSAEHSLKKAWDKALFVYQHLLWSDSLALEALPCFGASLSVM